MIATGGPNIVVTSMLRSGSTHIAYGLSDILRWRPASLIGLHGEGMDAHVVNSFSASILMPYGFQIFHQHTLATPRTIGILQNWRIKPIVVFRNIFDILVSLKDRVDALFPNVTIPGFMIPGRWKEMDDGEKYDWLAYHVTPWLLQFYGGWKYTDYPCTIVYYDEFYADQMAGFRSIIKSTGLEVPSKGVIKPVTKLKRKDNFHKGVSGRGVQVPRRLHEYVKHMANTWGEGYAEELLHD